MSIVSRPSEDAGYRRRGAYTGRDRRGGALGSGYLQPPLGRAACLCWVTASRWPRFPAAPSAAFRGVSGDGMTDAKRRRSSPKQPVCTRISRACTLTRAGGGTRPAHLQPTRPDRRPCADGQPATAPGDEEQRTPTRRSRSCDVAAVPSPSGSRDPAATHHWPPARRLGPPAFTSATTRKLHQRMSRHGRFSPPSLYARFKALMRR